MFIMVDGKHKMYRGGYASEPDAARGYDQAAIQLKGKKVRRHPV